MVLGTVDNVRAITSWPTEEEIPDSEIQDALAASTRRIVAATGFEESAWDNPPTNVNKPLADEAAEYCAASNIVMRIASIDRASERRKELQAACMDSTNVLIQALGMTEEDNPAFVDVTSEYTTYPLNENIDPYDPLL